MDRIDFRSDTVSWPTPAMREAMATAKVGDDVYGEDPTVNALETLAAEKVGKEAALFVASGTMGNLTGILTHASRGDEMVVGHDSHVMLWETGSVASLGGVVPKTLPTDAFGRMDIGEIENIVRWEDDHWPRHRLIHVENSYGNRGGYPLPPAYFAAIRDIADQYKLAVHMDGARLFNAAVAQDINAPELTQYVDSVTFCLSKGLCAPVGSLLCGSRDFIRYARRIRKSLGGGMRQAGILAAAGIVALEEMVERLGVDHLNAQRLAEGLASIPGIIINLDMVKTNIVFFELADDIQVSPEGVYKHMREKANVWIDTRGVRGFRAVTHYWIRDTDVNVFLDVLEDSLQR
jgi:threonine aldolase